jgi:hypothetical protein
MKAEYCLSLCLLASCEIRSDCDGAFTSDSLGESRRLGLFVAALHPQTPDDGLVYANQDTIRVKQSWMERTAKVNCQTENQEFAVLKGETIVLTLARSLPKEVGITLNGDHPLMFNSTRLTYNLSESAALPQELTFRLYASPEGKAFTNNSPLIKTWHFTR